MPVGARGPHRGEADCQQKEHRIGDPPLHTEHETSAPSGRYASSYHWFVVLAFRQRDHGISSPRELQPRWRNASVIRHGVQATRRADQIRRAVESSAARGRLVCRAGPVAATQYAAAQQRIDERLARRGERDDDSGGRFAWHRDGTATTGRDDAPGCDWVLPLGPAEPFFGVG